MKAVVFLGPSLPAEDARAVLADWPGEVVLRPPAALGDLYTALALGPTALGLVDGLFEQVPAVWHKEILYALSRGVHVYGAASMGALRAAELHDFGMRGVGRIFEDYASGVLEDDDEVAVAHAPEGDGFVPLSEAMVNLRHGLAQAVAASAISEPTRQTLLGLAKDAFYPERSWALLHELGTRAGLPADELAALRDHVKRAAPNAKRDDAVAMLRRMIADAGAGLSPHEPGFSFEPTLFWERLRESRSAAAQPDDDDAAVTHDALVRHACLTSERFRDVARAALMSHVSALEAERGQLEVSRDERARTAEAFRRQHRLLAGAEARAFLEHNAMSVAELTRAMEAEARFELLFERYRDALVPLLIRELKLRGMYADLAEQVHQKGERLRGLGLERAVPADVGLTDAQVIDWYEERYRPLRGPIGQRALEGGFGSEGELLAELTALYLLERDL